TSRRQSKCSARQRTSAPPQAPGRQGEDTNFSMAPIAGGVQCARSSQYGTAVARGRNDNSGEKRVAASHEARGSAHGCPEISAILGGAAKRRTATHRGAVAPALSRLVRPARTQRSHPRAGSGKRETLTAHRCVLYVHCFCVRTDDASLLIFAGRAAFRAC